MMDGPFVFVDIDTQRDFLEESGALYVPGSRAIVANLGRLSRTARDAGITVIATACCHLPDDAELSQFPPHCMAGTDGQRRIPETECAESTVLGVDDRLPSDLPRHLTLNKREFDVFSRPDAGGLVERLGASRPTFVVYGVATDYCVRAAVEGLLARAQRVAVVVDAIRAIDPEAESRLLSAWADRGVLLVMTDAVCQAVGTPAASAR